MCIPFRDEPPLRLRRVGPRRGTPAWSSLGTFAEERPPEAPAPAQRRPSRRLPLLFTGKVLGQRIEALVPERALMIDPLRGILHRSRPEPAMTDPPSLLPGDE